MFKNKKTLALVVLVLIAITAITLVGCTGQKITADEYKNFISEASLSKITNYKMTDIVTNWSSKSGEEAKATSKITSILFDGDKAYMTIEDDAAKIKDDTQKRHVQKYYFDLKNDKVWGNVWTKTEEGKKTKYVESFKLLSEDKNVFIPWDIKSLAYSLNEFKFEDFKFSKSNFVYEKENSAKTEKVERVINFKKDQLCWSAGSVKNKINDKYYVVGQQIFEVVEQKIELPTAK